MEINEYLVKLFRVIKDMENIDLFPIGARFSRTEFRLLREIVLETEKGKKIISSEISRRLGITRSAVSQIVTKFERENILKRVPSPTDRKITFVELTDSALAVFALQCSEANKLMKEVASRFGEDRLQKLIAEYDEFVSILEGVRREVYPKKG